MSQEPKWLNMFLEVLAASGNVSRASRAVGISPALAYKRRSASLGFAAAWASALDRYDAGGAAGGRGAAALRGAQGAAAYAPTMTVAALGAGGAKLIDSHRRRWTDRVESEFLGALAASANVARSAEAVGFSAESAYRRRYVRPGFALAWDRAVAVGRARIEALLVEAAGASLDPLVAEPPPGMAAVTVSEAIAIVRLLQKTGGGAAGELADDHEPSQLAEATERILARLKRMRDRDTAEKRAAGWSEDGETMIPPGWVRASEARCARCGSFDTGHPPLLGMSGEGGEEGGNLGAET